MPLQSAAIVTASSAVNRSNTESTCSAHRGEQRDRHRRLTVFLNTGVSRMMSRRAAGLTPVHPCDNPQGPRPAAHLERLMPDLPSGTVTFLFTDIEGSTAQ